MTSRPSVLLCTEGTYPFVGGGVSTWCDILCRELEEVDFTLFAVTGEPEVRLRYDLAANVRGIIQVPLFGTREPGEHVLSRLPERELMRRRRATSEKAVAAGFVPRLRRLLAAMEAPSEHPEDSGAVLWELHRWFRDHDWRMTWKSRAAWEAYLELAAERPVDPSQDPTTVSDAATAMRWLSGYLLPLAAAVPRHDMVHTTISGFASLAGIVARHQHGTPLLVTEHGVWVRERYIAISSGRFSDHERRFLLGLSRYLARVNYRLADVVSPVTTFNRRWELPYGAPPERVRTVFNGVDPGMFVPGPKPATTRHRPTAVAAARIFPLKDIEMMIRAAAVTRELVPDVLYLVYGSLDADVPYVERCRALIAQLGLEQTFVFGGHHSKPAEIYNEGDISVLSSISEAFPYTVLEAMSCARPVVGTDVGGVAEAMGDFGILVPPRDHEAFGRAVARLLTDHGLRARMGRQAREQVLAHFRVGYSVGGYRRFYSEILGSEAMAPAVDAAGALPVAA